jgi:HAD superfamily hydrolase (TIGR01509 family)
MTGKLAVEAKIFTNEQEAEKIIRDIYFNSQKTDKPYHTAYDILHQEYGLPLDYCVKRHHEILFQEFQSSFKVVEGIPKFMQELSHLKHIVLTHSNYYWVDSWSSLAGTRGYYDHIICNVEEGLGRKDKDLHLYSTLETRLDVNPENCLLIDDSIVGLKKAKEAGWITVWCKSNDNVSPDMNAPEYIDLSYTCVKDFLRDLIKYT